MVCGIAYRAIRKTENGVALTVVRDGQDTAIDADAGIARHWADAQY